MKQYRSLLVILILVALAIWLVLPGTTQIKIGSFVKNIETQLGLDLVGGAQIILEADLTEGQTADNEAMNTAAKIVENRVVGGLGATEAVVQRVGDKRISVEIPGQQDPQKALEAVKGTGLLEFVDMSTISQAEAANLVGLKINTDFKTGSSEIISATNDLQNQVWPSVMRGEILKNAAVSTNSVGQYEVAIVLTSDGSSQFATYTGEHIGDVLAIVLDKIVLSVPTINSRISDGEAVITGNFTYDEANSLAVQLRYGALPIALKVVETRSVGPSLGQDSLTKSLLAGGIGAILVILFMLIYYRLPGVVAVIALLIYGVITYALYRFIPVTLTLPGIAGFLLSTGSALDANILIFERLKEELRAGKPIKSAVTQGFTRAWSSIRDANIATIMVSIVLWFFGGQSGATIVIGFAFTLLVGVLVSLFTALFVTRSLLNLVLGAFQPENKDFWFGL